MISIFYNRCAPGRVFLRIIIFITASLFLSAPHLRADPPQYGMATLVIEDQGDQLTFNWHFFFRQFPAHFLLRERQNTPISLQEPDPAVLKQNLSAVVQAAFDVRIDGQPVQPKLLNLTLYSGRSCSVILSYPGHLHSKVEVRAPILQYLPPSFVFNVRIQTATGATGAFFGKNFPPVLHFVQGEVSRPWGKAFFSNEFAGELGVAWVNYNWILTCIVLLLMGQPKQMAVLILSIVVFWISLCLAATVFSYQLPYSIPQLALCLPTILLCIVCAWRQNSLVLLTAITLASGLLNACYDIQQIPLSGSTRTINALVGLSLGFAGGIALVLLAVVPLWWECRKYPGFQESWAPKISWIIAAIALFLPLQKWLFG
jgi:hypothetical protein